MKKLAPWLSVVIVISAFVYAFLAYFVVSVDPQTGLRHDGFGRMMSGAPFFVRMLGQHEWPGLAWFIGDFAIFWGGILIAYNMYRYGEKK
jgi:hypothetical protein